MKLREKIKKVDPEQIVSLKNRYGVFWTGRAKFVFGAVSSDAWNSESIEVIV